MYVASVNEPTSIIAPAGVNVSIPAMLNINEEDRIIQVCITLSAVESIERDFIVTLVTSDGTGT